MEDVQNRFVLRWRIKDDVNGAFPELPAMSEMADHRVAPARFQTETNPLMWLLAGIDPFPDVMLHDCLPQEYSFSMLICYLFD